MSRIAGKDTKPEMRVRRLLHVSGYRYRLHSKCLPGNPDVVLPKYKTVIQIHDCFWHQHKGCPDSGLPKTNTRFWEEKLSRNVERDKRSMGLLGELGWKVSVFWECETIQASKLRMRIANLLDHRQSAEVSSIHDNAN